MNLELLNQQRVAQRQLLGDKRVLQKEIDELVGINDTDRATIIAQTKQLDNIKAQAKKLHKAKSSAQPGETIKFKSKL